MAKYIKCARSNGLVMSERVFEAPQALGNSTVFWVQVQEPPMGVHPVWRPNCPEDQLKFQPYQRVPDSGNSPTVITENQGQWQHSISGLSAQQYAQEIAEKEHDTETYRLIKEWCNGQSEGCEEAFLNLGVLSHTDSRYQAYLQAVNEIKRIRRAM
ncbi:hypothetical protein [Endozoicomonas elysicola]|uniref:Uncharacterized protein n=1 Tax=Endozoicomonas elysicola TaxID=305900 RepID=A0A081KAP6_9GAMM|nr:hypothetical protein [Endozoicomonas elysicola]KEI71222.1 hypothetical protein GV64_11135 [Endozoicomonas elysicola]